MKGCEYGCLCWCFSWAVEHPVYNQLVQTPSSVWIWLCYSFWRINLSHFLSVVSKIWAKKSAIGKEEAAKLVDDTYRFIIACYSTIRGSSSIFSLFLFNISKYSLWLHASCGPIVTFYLSGQPFFLFKVLLLFPPLTCTLCPHLQENASVRGHWFSIKGTGRV
jgi:hypothetical protein